MILFLAVSMLALHFYTPFGEESFQIQFNGQTIDVEIIDNNGQVFGDNNFLTDDYGIAFPQQYDAKCSSLVHSHCNALSVSQYSPFLIMDQQSSSLFPLVGAATKRNDNKMRPVDTNTFHVLSNHLFHTYVAYAIPGGESHEFESRLEYPKHFTDPSYYKPDPTDWNWKKSHSHSHSQKSSAMTKSIRSQKNVMTILQFPLFTQQQQQKQQNQQQQDQTELQTRQSRALTRESSSNRKHGDHFSNSPLLWFTNDVKEFLRSIFAISDESPDKTDVIGKEDASVSDLETRTQSQANDEGDDDDANV